MNDYLVRGMSMDGFVKVVAIRSTELVRRGAQIQDTTGISKLDRMYASICSHTLSGGSIW